MVRDERRRAPHCKGVRRRSLPQVRSAQARSVLYLPQPPLFLRWRLGIRIGRAILERPYSAISGSPRRGKRCDHLVSNGSKRAFLVAARKRCGCSIGSLSRSRLANQTLIARAPQMPR